MEDILAILLIFGGGTMVALALSPIGRAIADRIRGGAAGAPAEWRRVAEGQQALLDEVDGVRRELAELQERMDFAERMLARQREQARLPDAGGGGPS